MSDKKIHFDCEIVPGKKDEKKYEQALVMLTTKSKRTLRDKVNQMLCRKGRRPRLIREDTS